jgi:cyclohexyl-isocyanide hydratase
MDQADFTGPLEVLSRVRDSSFHVIGKTKKLVRDVKVLILTPALALSEAPQLDVLLVPGGNGVNALMEDEEVLCFLRNQAAGSKIVLSVCTGALICGAAGLLKGKLATTHWASHGMLSLFGALPVDARVVEDGSFVTAAGVTSGIDAALRVAAMSTASAVKMLQQECARTLDIPLRGDEVARRIQFYMQYAPEPPFDSGSPESAPAAIVQAAQASMSELLKARAEIAKRAAAKI